MTIYRYTKYIYILGWVGKHVLGQKVVKYVKSLPKKHLLKNRACKQISTK